ncbi:hypothetical protein SEA_YAGO84_43 [Gordonia phage Yago84]|nr:hypothetical protein SEA_YAGO84_43 [Gordonia phage Yago84]QIG58971.1 hypothetical protein SEA_ANCLAR_44 [Gordonia phage AnClar]WIC90025.1 hypothetical protein SEA_SISKO_43 [Gordonia phage Sisko]
MANSPFSKGSTATKGKAAAATKDDDATFATATEDGDVKPGKPAGDPFSLPPAPSEVNISDLVGVLVLCKPTEVIESMQTEVGTAENVVRADITAVDGDLAGQTFEDVLVFQTALKRALLKVLDGPNPMLLGRIEMGNKKPGKNAPYLFGKPDEDDIAAARAVLAG